jgi:hypothetical protein
MRTSWRRTVTGTIGLGLLALPLVAVIPSGYGAKTQEDSRLWVVRLPGTPSQIAMREAAVWWAKAIQLASEEQEAARAALHAWDSAAPFDEQNARQQALASDHGGYLERALAAVRQAEHLARTPAEKQRAERRRRDWGAASRLGQV